MSLKLKTLEKMMDEITEEIGFGLRESIYQNALIYLLRESNFVVDLEVNKQIFFRNLPVGMVRLDILVDQTFVIEMKAIMKINEKERLQVENYLRATDLKKGFLININKEGFEIEEIELNI